MRLRTLIIWVAIAAVSLWLIVRGLMLPLMVMALASTPIWTSRIEAALATEWPPTPARKLVFLVVWALLLVVRH